LLYPSVVVAAIGVAALVVWFLLGWKQLTLRAAEGKLQAKTARLEADIKRCGLEVESVDEVISTIGDLEREVLSQQQDTQARKADLENLFKERDRIDGRIASKAEQIAELNGTISALQVATRMESIGDYQAALERRTRLEAAADAKRTILNDMLPTDRDGEEALAEWETRIETHLQAAADEEQIEYDAEAQKRIAAEIESLEERKREIQSALLQGSRKLHGVEVKAKELGVLESSPPCRSTQELDHIGSLISSFCDRVERDRRVAQDAIRICRQIDAEERARVSDLFGPESLASRYVSTITNGRYTEVRYDPGKNSVHLITDEGDRLPADFLSGGAFDQLYLAIRVAIATRLMSNEKGFLILDDPFIKADTDRLGRMMDLLRVLVDDGWQILYFTAKDEVSAALSDDIGAGRVQLLQLDALRANERNDQRDADTGLSLFEASDNPPEADLPRGGASGTEGLAAEHGGESTATADGAPST
jgi:hypothetical protein